MKEEKRLFPAQEKSERVLDIIRKHWFVYLLFWMIALFMLTPFIFLIIFWTGNPEYFSPLWVNIIILLSSAYLLFILGLLIYGFTDFYLDVYIITDRRIVDITQNGFFNRTISELNVTEIQDVNAEVTGFVATILHFGNVNIQTAGEMPNFKFEAIPHPYEVSKKVLDLHEAFDKKTRQEDREGIEDEMLRITKMVPKEAKSTPKETELCYSEETCNQKILHGLNKHIEEEPQILVPRTQTNDQEGELSEGKAVEL